MRDLARAKDQIRSLKKPIFGKVMSVFRHKNADRLYIAIVDVARVQYVQVVFGGSTIICEGDVVAVAMPGTWLPSGEKIRARNYRGMRSFAEILSRDELFGTTGGPDEILVLNEYSNRIGESVDLHEIMFFVGQEEASRADRRVRQRFHKVHRS